MRKRFIPLFFCFLMFALPFVGVFGYAGVVRVETDDDTYVSSGAEGGNNYDGTGVLYAGHLSNYQYMLANFNLTETQNLFDSGYFNDNVHLRFYYQFQSSGQQAQTHYLYVYRITQWWNVSAVTYNTRPTITSLLYNHSFTKSGTWNVNEFVYVDIRSDFYEVLMNASGTTYFYGYYMACTWATGTGAFMIEDSPDANPTHGYPISIIYGYDEDESVDYSAGGSAYTTAITSYLALFLVVFLPAMILAGAVENNRFVGFVSGLCLGVGMGVISGIVPVYFLFLCGMLIVVLFKWGR